MAWDSSRPVPWQRLMREWVVYALIMVGVLFLLVRDNMAGAVAGVLISGPLYLAFGAVLAKFGYRRKTMKELRAERETRQLDADADAASSSSRPSSRPRPPATSRTQAGSNRPRPKKRR